MKGINIKYLLLFFVIEVISFTSFSQAWVKPKGQGYAQIGYSYISASKIYGIENIDEQLRREVADQTIQGYLEYGVCNNLMLTASLPFKLLQTGEQIFETDYVPDTLSSGRVNAFGNLSFSAVYGLSQKTNWVSSISVGLDTKTATFNQNLGLRTGVDAWSGVLGLNLGRGWNKSFFQTNVGFKFRSNNYSEQFIASAQYGRTLNKFQIIFGLELYKSFKNGTFDDLTSVHTGVYQNDLEFLAFSLKANYALSKRIKLWALLGGGVAGQLVARAPSYALTFSYEWDGGE
jgi:hypothetical protein